MVTRKTSNRLLLALPPDDLERLWADLVTVECKLGDVLVDADSVLDHVYFPDSGVISIVAVYPNGSVIEMATIGREGGTGFQAIFKSETSSARLLVQLPGTAARMSRPAFVRAMEKLPVFRDLMSAHLHAFLEQVMVSAACNGAHGVEERLARWLLMMRDRNDGDVMNITQELLAEMLGVHRPTITNTLGRLEEERIVKIGRRKITLVSRDALLRKSCECYQLVRLRIAQHLPRTFPE